MKVMFHLNKSATTEALDNLRQAEAYLRQPIKNLKETLECITDKLFDYIEKHPKSPSKPTPK